MYKLNPDNPGTFSFSGEAASAANAEALEGDPLSLITLDKLAEDRGWLSYDEKEDDAPAPIIAILKIDVEGLEPKVLRGARQLLASGRVKNVFMELKGTQAVEEWEGMFAILYDAGFELYKFGQVIGPGMVVGEKFENGKELAANIARRNFESANVWFRLSR